MKADTLNLKDVFSKDIRYLVPLFQRPYVWEKDKHWEPLWEDVRTVTEHLLAEIERADEQEIKEGKPEQETPPHFLGAIVVDQLRGPVRDLDARNVIDGQQRLATLQVLLDAAQLVVADLGSDRDGRLLRKLILNDEDVVLEDDHLFKVWPTNVDRDAFRAAMTDEASTDEHSKSSLVQAHSFFESSIREWAEPDSDADKRAHRLSALTSTLRGLLRMVIIDLEPEDNAQVIFETLNARGTPLLASDLIKNLLLQEAERVGTAVEPLYDERWKQFDSKDWRREVRQGRLYRPRIDTFLNYWLIMRTVREVPAHHLFPSFRTYLRVGDRPVAEVMAEMQRYGEVYNQLDQWDWQSPEGTFLYRWSTMQATVLTPLLLWLFGFDEDDLPVEQRRLALDAVDSWLVRRMICRLTTKNYNRITLDLLEILDDSDPSTAGDTIVSFLAGQSAETAEWPTDGQVTETLLAQPVYRQLSRARLRMVLEGLEDDLRSSLSEEPVQRGKLTIEHVLPQGWREHWPAPDGPDPEAEAGRRDRALHAIGNLTLVNNKLNPTLSNHPWEKKKPVLAEHSVLRLNQRILADDPETWDEAAMDERAAVLGDRVVALWPASDALRP